MIFLGLLSLIQSAILPGWLIIYWWKSPNWLARVLVAFGFSLLFNHLLVIGLVAVGLFQRSIIFELVALEMIVYGIILWRDWPRGAGKPLRIVFPLDLTEEVSAPRWFRVVVLIVAVVLSLVAVGAVVNKILEVNPGVFNIWDDFVSFNKWALQWYAGRFPDQTLLYPQLIPTNWALMYKIVGNSDIQIFAKLLMGIFPIFLATSFIERFYQTRKSVWLFGLIFTSILLFGLAGPYIGSGYTDIPVAFLAWMGLIVLTDRFIGHQIRPAEIIISLVLMVAATMTKQAGLFMIIPLLIWLGISWRWFAKSALFNIVKMIGVLVIFLAMISPWYAYKLWDVSRGRDSAEITGLNSALISAYGTTSPRVVLVQATQKFSAKVSDQTIRALSPLGALSSTSSSTAPSQILVTIISVLWLLLLLLGGINRFARTVLLTVVLPFYFIWAIKYSYDFRNLTLILPFVGMVAGFGVITLIDQLSRRLGHQSATTRENCVDPPVEVAVHIKKPGYLKLGVLAILLILSTVSQIIYPAKQIYAMQDRLMRDVGIKPINEKLYAYYSQYGLSGKIRSMYQPLNYLPQLKEFSIADGSLLTLTLLQEVESDPDIHYVLWWMGSTDKDAGKYISERVDLGKYQLIFQGGNYYFLKIK